MLLVIGIIFRKFRFLFLCVATMTLLLFGYPRLPWKITEPMVARFENVKVIDDRVRRVVVLAGRGFATNDSVPANSRASPEVLYRFMEGVRLLRAIPNSKMILSIGSPDSPTEAEALARELADLVGIEISRVETVVGAVSTVEEAQMVRNLVGRDPFYLVTSDFHLPRAMLVFSERGLNAIPAPVGSSGRGDGERPLVSGLFPNAMNLAVTDRSLHEALGMAWEKLNGHSSESDSGGEQNRAVNVEFR